MTSDSTWRIQISFKTSAGTLINCRAETAAELNHQVAFVADIAGLISTTEQTLGAVGVVARNLPLAPSQPETPQPQGWGPRPVAPLPTSHQSVAPHPAAAPNGASGATPTQPGPVCNCGLPAKLVPGGVSRSTKQPYRAFYACPQDRDYQCSFRANA